MYCFIYLIEYFREKRNAVTDFLLTDGYIAKMILFIEILFSLKKGNFRTSLINELMVMDEF